MGIPIGSTFDLNAGVPIDSRIKKPSVSERDAIIDVARYEGLEVYVEGDAKYRLGAGLTDSDWDKIIDTQSALEVFGDNRYALKSGESGENFQTNDLEVFGTLILHNEITEYNATVIPIDDAFVQLNAGNTEVDSGIIIDKGADGESRFYNAASDNKWYLTDPLNVTGDVISDSIIYANGGNSSQWNAAYNWGDHATEGYLKTESDPTVPSYVKSIAIGDISDWNTAYNHSQITTGNPHNLNLADIGESLSSINYWTKTGNNLSYSGGNISLNGAGNSYPLNVRSETADRVVQSWEANNSTNLLGFFYESDANAGTIYLRDNTNTNKLLLNSDGDSYFNGGNVGIKTTSPSYTLDVNGIIRSAGDIIGNSNIYLSANSASIHLGKNNKTGPHGLYFYDDDDTVGIQQLYRTSPEQLQWEDSNGSNLMVLSKSGTLAVSGNVVADTYFRSSDTAVVLGTSGSSGTIYLRPNGYGSTDHEVLINSQGELILQNGDGGSNNSEIFISPGKGSTGSGQISITDNGDMSWAFGGDDGDNSFKIHGSATSNIPTIYGLNSPLFKLTTSGNLTVSGEMTADNFILSSDYRLKENISSLSSEIVKFNYKNKSTKRLRYGVIAQELQKTNPEMVYEGEDGYLKVAYIDFLIKKVADLENEIKSLKYERKN